MYESIENLKNIIKPIIEKWPKIFKEKYPPRYVKERIDDILLLLSEYVKKTGTDLKCVTYIFTDKLTLDQSVSLKKSFSSI